MRTDKLVYLLLQLAPQGFFALIGRNPDDANRYEFKSVELKEVAFRLDGVLAPKSDDDIVYFIEAQFQPDANFYARFLAEIFVYLKQYPTKKWQAVVIYPARSVEQKGLEGYEDLLELKRLRRVYLNELQDIESASVGLFRLLAEPERAARELARKIAAKASQRELDLIEQILSYKFNTLTRKEIREMLGIQEELLKDTAFYKEAFEEGRQAGEAQGRAEGEAKGRAEGRAEGERAAKLAIVPLLRELGLSDETIAEKLNLPLADVKSPPPRNATS
ncbi:MAG: Rpn family recombination-promoting nuclease/putative transposase [Chloroherpetonaceae bacterium]|nr:Rpn family recombination-promoting nuclease/putative transposase [Chloroherpetonaceae bacterium]MDW8438307.1 Rpn family recombination-promoting nuclease/putative transposase [Chloroherpetonaceae bacterium]